MALNNHRALSWDFVALGLRQRSAGWFFWSTWNAQRSLSGIQLAGSCVLAGMVGRLCSAGTVDKGICI